MWRVSTYQKEIRSTLQRPCYLLCQSVYLKEGGTTLEQCTISPQFQMKMRRLSVPVNWTYKTTKTVCQIISNSTRSIKTSTTVTTRPCSLSSILGTFRSRINASLAALTWDCRNSISISLVTISLKVSQMQTKNRCFNKKCRTWVISRKRLNKGLGKSGRWRKQELTAKMVLM